MSRETIEYWARKFFPHLTPQFGFLAVIAVLQNPKAE
jgi:hypothetical protein